MDGEQAPREPALFLQCRLCIIRSQALDADTADQLLAAIEENGGDAFIHQSPAPLPPVNGFTHVVSPTIEFPGHDTVCDALIPVVKPQWIYASIAKYKLANPRQYNPDPRLFLNDVVVTCSDLPDGDKDAIIGGVLAMGGLYSSRLTLNTTHLVALTAESDKCRVVESKRLNTKIVLPHWFDDCLKLGKRIDERPYLLPDPEILYMRADAPVRTTENKDIIGASTPEPKSLQLETPIEARDDLIVFQGKKVMMSDDLGVDRLLSSMEQLIIKGGGQVVHDVRKTDIYICRYREGQDYILASRLGKDVGNLSWLFHLITRNVWTSPLRRLLHYPLSRSGIPGFQKFKISLSNYAGEARIYLENLIAASGAECTKTLKQDNTHLITAHGNSEKCTAAKEWSLNIVNHLWLEESYAKWQLQTVSDPRYTHFPHRTNLGEIVGQTKIDKFAIEEHFFPEEDGSSSAITASTAMQQKDTNKLNATATSSKPIRKTKAKNNNNTKQNSTLQVPNTATPQGQKNGKSVATSTTTTTPARGKERSLQTPLVSKFLSEGKENDTPSTTGSRKSKDIAAARLHEIAPDIALYEKEKKRVGGVIYGGRRKSDQNDETVSGSGRKRSMEPEDFSDDGEVSEMKKQKKSKPPVKIHLLITGYTRWVGNASQEDTDKSHLRSLGIQVVQDASKCTHLAARSILRTHKFANALAYSPKIITTEFITDCILKDRLLNPDEYPLRDPESESKYRFSLEDSRKRALKNKNKLLDGKMIYCVENIRGGFDAFKSIVETNGGQCALYRGRSGMAISGRRTAADEGQHAGGGDAEEVFLISGLEKSHMKLWPKFRTMVQDARKVPRIVGADWLLEIAMSQEWRSDDNFELCEADVQMADE
ncbi:hypothetical protein AJ80_06763 [Polytolypa hystricis UAMH7299]|uniref:BRCT domain-containing protein n=1 Tax=Polytolypa hystricis (strain UAMH7299) TaxID=1447883 RepID=A0A2B7XUB0_POLH7|nr:hypothetical protein AJ80_06763 [Polytolypa hystricis UAMH7299]